MARGMAPVAQCDQILGRVDAPGGTRDQMMNVRFTGGTELPATLAPPFVASENDGSHFAPTPFDRIGSCGTHSRIVHSAKRCSVWEDRGLPSSKPF